MRGLTRLFSILLIVLMPVTASAQFVPIQQAKELGNQTQQTDLDNVLGAIYDYSGTARKQVQSVLADAGSKKIGASAAGRKIETIIGNLKTKLNGVINAYAKKNPPSPSLRTAFNAAQDSLNNIRRQSSEVLDQVGFDKAAAPNQLSGKYLDYQNKIKDIAAKGLQDADDRLSEKGSQATIKAALKKTVEDTQQQIDIATNSFLAVNTDVLPSALNRIKTAVLNDFSTSMATRYKTANGLGTDKALDLSEADQAAVSAAKKEMSDAVDRALNTIEQLTTQVANSNLPSASNVPGVNPYLEAKFKADKQLKQIRDSVNSRIDTIKSRFNSRTDVSALAKEVFAPEADKEKNRLNDGVTEMEVYFTSGDPTKKQYNKAKNNAQDEAAGCTDFLCSIGRAVSTVGSGLLSVATKGTVNVNPQTFTGIMGISDPKGYVPSKYTGSNYGSVANVNGRYYSPGISGGTTVPFNPNCIGDLPAKNKLNGLAFVGVAKAQDNSFPDPEAAVIPNTTQNDTSATNTNDSRGSTAAGADAGAAAYGIGNGTSGGTGAVVDTGVGNETQNNGTKSTTTTKKSTGLFGIDWSKVQQYTPFLNAALNGGLSGQSVFGRCYGQYGINGSLPGQYGSVYNSPFGGLPVGQTLGFPGNNVGLNQGLLGGTNYAAQLAIGLGLRSQLGGPYASQYAQAAKLFGEGPMTLERFAQVAQVLQQTDFFSRSGTFGTSDPYDPSTYFYALCSQIMGGGTNLVNYCKSMLSPTNTTGINGTIQGNIFAPRTATAQDPDVTQINSDNQFMDYMATYLSPATKCKTPSHTTREAQIETRLNDFETQYLASNSTNKSQVLAALGTLRQKVEAYKRDCNNLNGLGSGFNGNQSTGISATSKKVDEFTRAVSAYIQQKNCDDGAIIAVDAMDTLSLRQEILPYQATDPVNYANVLSAIVNLEGKKQSFCSSRLFPSVSSASGTQGVVAQGNTLASAGVAIGATYGLYVQIPAGDTSTYTVSAVNVNTGNVSTTPVSSNGGFIQLPHFDQVPEPTNTYKVYYRPPDGVATQLGSFMLTRSLPTWCITVPSDITPHACTGPGR